MSPKKPLLTDKNLHPLIREERKNIGFLHVETFKKRKAEYAHQRSLAWYHLIRANVVKAMAHAQAAIDIRTMKNPNAECRLDDGAHLHFRYESVSDRDIRLAAQKKAEAERRESLGEHVVKEVFEKMANAGS